METDACVVLTKVNGDVEFIACETMAEASSLRELLVKAMNRGEAAWCSKTMEYINMSLVYKIGTN